MKAIFATATVGSVLLFAASHPEARTVGADPATARGPALAAVSAAARNAHVAPAVDVETLDEVVERYCVRCHSERRLTGNLSLEDFAVGEAVGQAEVAERVIRKLRADMMPPPGASRPAGDTLVALVETLERTIDDAAAGEPRPGDRPFQRLNRAEYERAIADLFGLHVDAGQWLPLDQISASFDNVADVQAFSPTLMDAYLTAASDISRQVLGNPDATAVETTYQNDPTRSQHEWDRAEGAPYGTRGGVSVLHTFPADGKYVVSLGFISGWAERFDDIDISVDGERVALLRYQGADTRLIDFQGRLAYPVRTDSVFVRAGQRRLTAAFIRKMDGPYEDVIRPNDWSLTGTEASYGTTSLPHIMQMTVEGPFDVTGVSETDTRSRVFTCRPAASDEARPCAEQIVTRLATQAYRRPLEPRDIDGLMYFYEEGARDGGFEVGVRSALEAMLVSPHFLFRFERTPAGVAPGQVFEIPDVDLASRLSFFLWGTGPDERLLDLAGRGELNDPETLRSEARRMLADPRSEALATRFASLWLRLQDLDKVQPDAFWFPNYNQQISRDMRRETELFFVNLIREDRSLLDLLEADYTFVNERLARHYGIDGVVGDDFRRVSYPDDRRQGVLGHGSMLVQTSYGNRTSPVLRGKWIMEVLLGTPPPPPPPNVPTLDESTAQEGTPAALLTTADRMRMHRRNPTCNSCHQLIDPIGIALDNFDVTGQWRTRENGMPLDTQGEFYDGSEISSPVSLVSVLKRRPVPFSRHFALNLMTYALGRRVDYMDQPAVRAIARDAEQDGYRVSSFILGVVASDQFRLRRAATTDANND
jgi:cytochrome c5